jgi:CDP-diacylglycerol---glycerol-3-phosphate 3-phosphatidyltransferase
LASLQNASTPFGAFLDPVADKLMVAAVLILLCTRPLAAGPLAGDALLVPCCTLGVCASVCGCARVCVDVRALVGAAQ